MEAATFNRGRLRATALAAFAKWSRNEIRVVPANGPLAWQHHDLRPALERFRYNIYVLELRKNLPQADHLTKRLPDGDDAGAFHFIALDTGGDIVGCVRLHMAPHIPVSVVRALNLGSFVGEYAHPYSFVSKLMVERSLRGKSVALQLMEAMVDFARNNYGPIEICFFNCHPKLVALYERYGFRKFGLPFMDDHVGLQIPMFYMLGDAAHLESIGSPLLRKALEHPISEAHRIHLVSLLQPEGAHND